MPAIPTLPKSFRRRDLEDAGFAGWHTWKDLRATNLASVPAGPIVYVVYHPSSLRPSFLKVNPGGHFKGKDPTVPIKKLAANWVVSSNVIYIGKADAGRKRLSQFARFGSGQDIGHWGGRYIWQLGGSDEQLVAWHVISWNELAREYEKRLLVRFRQLHGGVLPFANLAG